MYLLCGMSYYKNIVVLSILYQVICNGSDQVFGTGLKVRYDGEIFFSDEAESQGIRGGKLICACMFYLCECVFDVFEWRLERWSWS